MMNFHQRLKLLLRWKVSLENKGLLQASWPSPCPCWGSFPMARLKPGHLSLGPSTAQLSTLGWCALSAREPASGPGWGGLLVANQLGSRTSAGSWVCNLYPAWTPLFSCQFVGWFLSGHVALGRGLETEIASSSGWAPAILHGRERHGEGKIAASPCSGTTQLLS